MRLSSLLGFQKSAPSTNYMIAYKSASRRNNLIRREAKVGGAVFGPVPAGRTREFFCLDEYTWIWSESWFDEKNGVNQQIFVRYEFTPHGVLKIVNDISRGYVKGKELRNLLRAMESYSERVKREVYAAATQAA